MPFLASFLPGYGAVSVSTLAVASTSSFGGAMDINAAMSVDGDLTMETGRVIELDTATSTTDLALQFRGDPNLGLYRDSADAMRFIANGSLVMIVANGLLQSQGSHTFANNAFFQGYASFAEIAAPGAAAANTTRVYAVDDGGAKTDLVAIFPTGAAQIFAQEP